MITVLCFFWKQRIKNLHIILNSDFFTFGYPKLKLFKMLANGNISVKSHNLTSQNTTKFSQMATQKSPIGNIQNNLNFDQTKEPKKKMLFTIIWKYNLKLFKKLPIGNISGKFDRPKYSKFWSKLPIGNSKSPIRNFLNNSNSG